MSCAETEHFVKNWNRIHKQTARALAAAPADQLDWRPREGMFTLGELVRHIAEAESGIVRTALAGSMQKGDLDLASASVEEVVRAFKESHERLTEEVGKLTLDQLNEEIEAFGHKMHRIVLLWAMTEHEIHHRGQYYTYLRLVGVEPPPLYA
ncbi:MAG TPA: DinB family protein [Blastocatellia bacterium]|nr:DinB family protein [Blastocatellia bacterium]